MVLGSSQTGASIDARGNGSDAKKPGTSVANEGGHSPVAQGKSAFRALLSLDEKELVVGRSPGSHLRKRRLAHWQHFELRTQKSMSHHAD